MFRTLLKSKIHRARVTEADLHYEGSITIDSTLMEAADLVTHEHVHVWNITTGSRFETYVIPGAQGSGTIQINGAAAHHAKRGDLVIISSFVQIEATKINKHQPRIVFLDNENRIRRITRFSGNKAQD